jgi:hypothetical protein
VEGGEISLCKWPIKLDPYNQVGVNTIHDVLIEGVYNGVWVVSGDHWMYNGIAFYGGTNPNGGDIKARLDSGSLTYVGLNEFGNVASPGGAPTTAGFRRLVATPTAVQVYEIEWNIVTTIPGNQGP